MDIIKAAKEKYNMQIDDDVNQALLADFSRLKVTLSERDRNLLGWDRKLEELKSRVDITKESVITEKQIFRKKLQNLQACMQQVKELETDKNNLLREIHEMEKQRNRIKNRGPSMKDQQIMQHGQKKLDYYKQLTGIKWDFTGSKGFTKGYVSNGKDYIRTFSYKNDNRALLEEQLWNEIVKVSQRIELTETDVTNGKDYIRTFNYKNRENYSELEDQLMNEIGRVTERLELTETDESKIPNIS